MPDYTQWLNSSRSEIGDDQIAASLYLELKGLARSRIGMERPGHTLNTTALVHEVWLRLQKSAPERWRDRKQFFAAAAEAMRRILVEAARHRTAAKRGGGEEHLPVHELEIASYLADERLLEVHEVLDRLEAEDPVKAQIVKLRFFSGLSHEEIASLLEVNEKTVRRQWTLAKVWLYRAIAGESLF